MQPKCNLTVSCMCECKGPCRMSQLLVAICHHAATVVDQRGPSSETPQPGATVTDTGGSGWSKQEVKMHRARERVEKHSNGSIPRKS